MQETLVSRHKQTRPVVWVTIGGVCGALLTSLVFLVAFHGVRQDSKSTPSELVAETGKKTGCGPWGCPVPPAHNNNCADKFPKIPPGPKTLDCPRFVVESTDQTWHSRSLEKSEAAINKYFAPHWQSVRAFGTVLNGREGLRSFMKDWLTGFPDVFIYVSDVFCEGNDEIGYKTTMPYILTATNTGPSEAFGPATGAKIKYHGIANCYILKIDGQWQYTTEWDVPDMLSFLNAMNKSSLAYPHPKTDLMTVDECKPLFEWGTGKMNWFPKKIEEK